MVVLLVHLRQRYVVDRVAGRAAAAGRSGMAGDQRLPPGTGAGCRVGASWPVGPLCRCRRLWVLGLLLLFLLLFLFLLFHLLLVVGAGDGSPRGCERPGVLHFSWVLLVRKHHKTLIHNTHTHPLALTLFSHTPPPP